MNIYSVYEKYHRDFLSFAKSIAKEHNEAFDLVQDAYVSAIEREDTFEWMNQYQIKGWFFTTIKNKNIDNIRKSSKNIYKDNIDIFTNKETFEEKVVVKDLLSKLPKKYKEIISLRYVSNLNSTEIGKILDISPSTVRSQISKGISLLKTMGGNNYVKN